MGGQTPEGVVLAEVIAFCEKVPGLRLSRNHSGMTRSFKRYGCFSPGGSDLIGWMREHHGIAQFVAIEVKAPGEKATPEQERFLDDVRRAGGIAGVVHSVEEAAALLGVDLA